MPNRRQNNINGAYFGDNGLVIAVGHDGIVLISRDGGASFESHILNNRLPLAAALETESGSFPSKVTLVR